MRITCPLCGERPLEEFTYRGDASVRRPASADPHTMEEWYEYVFLRDNPRGPHVEHWRHGAGCGAWLVVERDTLSHKIASVKLARGGKAAGR